MLEPGDKLDRYEIEAVIGEGGMGRVYKARDTRLHRSVALKVLRREEARGEAAESGETNPSLDPATRLLREARAAAALDHPNAVSVFDVGESGDHLYIAMEYVAGKTLRPYVEDRALPWDVKLRILVDAARALAAAHERGLVHRDVKPENVMVRADGMVKVLDFGIAKRMPKDFGRIQAASESDQASSASQTAGGLVLGTPRYLSPEQVRGQPVDGRADQFAWGVVAYEVLSGKLPWGDDVTGLQLLMAILTRPAPPLGERCPELPHLVEATIMKTLAKSPGDRFPSMEHVVLALEQFVTQRRSRTSMTELESIATFKTELAPALVTSAPPPVARPPKPPPPRRGRGWMVALPLALIAIGAIFVGVHLAGRAPAPAPSGSGGVARSGPTAITDLPPPATTSDEARAAFHAYAQSFRDADFDSARQNLARAAQSDPALAAAYLRLAFMDSQVAADEAEVPRTFKKAVQYRSTLTPRDQTLLDAFAPYFQSEPSDTAECERRLSAATQKYPEDAELAYYLGSVRFDRGELAEAVVAFDQAVAIDPKFAQAFATRAGIQAYLGDLDRALASLQACLALSPAATECSWYAAQIHEQQGDCAAMEADARAWIQKDPDDWYAYQWLARALYAQGGSMDVVRTALEQKWVRIGPERRTRAELLDRVRIALAEGDFTSAEARARELESHLLSEPGALAHADVYALLVEALREEGKLDEARKVAEAYLARQDAWSPPHRVDDAAIGTDPAPVLLSTLFRARAIDRATFEARREEWLRNWRSKTGKAYQGFLWVYGWAQPAESEEDGAAAMKALDAWAPLPPFMPQSLGLAHVGRAQWLGGRRAEALTTLRRATSTCIALYEPVVYTQTQELLGRALEQAGDKDGACAAWGAVVARWGHARPRSITAEAARKNAARVGCPR